MVKVINISSRTVEIAGVDIKPHKGYIFQNMTVKDRQRLSAMSAVGIVRAYEGDYSNEIQTVNTDNQDTTAKETTTTNRKPARRSNRKK